MTIIVTSRRGGRRRSKYNARRTVYNGVTYDSRREAEVAAELDMLRRASDPKRCVIDVQRQVRIPLVVNGQKICTHVLDFLVTYADGRKELVEVKGYETAVWKLKRKLLEATWLREHEDVIYKIVK